MKLHLLFATVLLAVLVVCGLAIGVEMTNPCVDRAPSYPCPRPQWIGKTMILIPGSCAGACLRREHD